MMHGNTLKVSVARYKSRIGKQTIYFYNIHQYFQRVKHPYILMRKTYTNT